MATSVQASVKRMHAADLIDPRSEIHYALHRTLSGITTEHDHDFYELFLIARGMVDHVCRGEVETLSAGALVFVRPDDIHYYRRHATAECAVINLAFLSETFRDLCTFLGPGFPSKDLTAAVRPPKVHLPFAERTRVEERLTGFSTIDRHEQARVRTYLRGTLADLFANYFDTHIVTADPIPPWLREVMEFMRRPENLARGTDAMREHAGCTPEHLARTVKRHFGITPTDYVNDVRLNYAANILTSTDHAVPEIALKCGFENLSHFYHLFRAKFGTPPARFRRLHRRTLIPE